MLVRSVVGKTEIGMVNARYAPAAARTIIRKISDFEYRATQYPLSLAREVRCRRNQDLSFDSPLFIPTSGDGVAGGGLGWNDLHLRVVRKGISAVYNESLSCL